MIATVDENGIRGFLHEPEKASGNGLVLTHGAGGNANAPTLRAIAETFCAAGVAVLRCDLPFRQKRPFGPPSPSGAAADRKGLADAVAWLRQRAPGKAILGGLSYGGRQASMLGAEQAGIADALLLLSYPLHPPGKPDQWRTAHFPLLRIPTVFVQGTRDPFGSIEEMRQAVALIPAHTELVVVENAGHDLAKGQFGHSDLPKLLV